MADAPGPPPASAGCFAAVEMREMKDDTGPALDDLFPDCGYGTVPPARGREGCSIRSEKAPRKSDIIRRAVAGLAAADGRQAKV
jgi:hypothetical protein